MNRDGEIVFLRRTVMSKSISETASQLGNTVSEAAKTVGSKVAQGAEDAVDFIKAKTGLGSGDGNAF